MHEFTGNTPEPDIRSARCETPVSSTKPGTLVTLTGPSGSGKTTVEKLLTALRPEEFTYAVSHTTRDMRAGEKEGEAYYFVPKIDFHALEIAGEFLESIEYNGSRYGISKKEISDKVNTGRHTILVVEPVGAAQIRARYDGDLVQVYIDADEESVRCFMLARGDSPKAIEERIQNDRDAIRSVDRTYDARITNDSSIASLCLAVADLARNG